MNIRSGTPTYWTSQFESFNLEVSPDNAEDRKEGPQNTKESPEETKRQRDIRKTTSKSVKHRRQKSGESNETKTGNPPLPKPMKRPSTSPPEDEGVPIQEESSSSTSELQQIDSVKTEGSEEETRPDKIKPQCNSESPSRPPEDINTSSRVPEDTQERPRQETQNDVLPHTAVSDQEREETEHAASDASVESITSNHSLNTQPLPCKTEVVDVNKLDKDAEANESYFSHSHWSNPSHMSAFIDGRRGDGLEAIPEGSCEESECLMWNSLPTPGPGVLSVSSPRRPPMQELQRTLSGVLDPRASSSLSGESPFAADPRMSPSVSGSLNIDNQKRLDTLEQVLTLCSNLYNKGRWHELGHILTQIPKQTNLIVRLQLMQKTACFREGTHLREVQV